MKSVFIVLGEGRSGTSALTKGLPIIGLDIGTKLRPAAPDNPRGFFEDSSVLSLNRVISRRLQDPVFNVKLLPVIEDEAKAIFPEYKAHAKKILNSRLENKTNWAFKDPRTMVLLPFWQAMFDEMQIDDRYIIMVRHPLASVKSGTLFFGSDIEILLLTWVYNYIAALQATYNKPRVVVLYDQLLRDPLQVYQHIKDDLNLESPINQSLLNEYADSFLDKKLNHHGSHEDPDMPYLCLRLYNFLVQLAEGKLKFGSTEFNDEWHEILNEFSRVKSLYHYTHQLYCETKSQQKEIRSIGRSLIWRLTAPLHSLNEMLRKHKNNKRESERLEKVC
jgi:hypothetical protein